MLCYFMFLNCRLSDILTHSLFIVISTRVLPVLIHFLDSAKQQKQQKTKLFQLSFHEGLYFLAAFAASKRSLKFFFSIVFEQ